MFRDTDMLPSCNCTLAFILSNSITHSSYVDAQFSRQNWVLLHSVSHSIISPTPSRWDNAGCADGNISNLYVMILRSYLIHFEHFTIELIFLNTIYSREFAHIFTRAMRNCVVLVALVQSVMRKMYQYSLRRKLIAVALPSKSRFCSKKYSQGFSCGCIIRFKLSILNQLSILSRVVPMVMMLSSDIDTIE